MLLRVCLVCCACLAACSTPQPEPQEAQDLREDSAAPATDQEDATQQERPQPTAPVADVTEVQLSGQPGAYTFSVTLRSQETGCQQYADWWEVLSEDGRLLYRRILAHSHVSEQPFTRSGGPVPLDAQDTVLVRAHMHPGGYGGQVLRGGPGQAFEPVQMVADAFSELESEAPLPSGCAF